MESSPLGGVRGGLKTLNSKQTLNSTLQLVGLPEQELSTLNSKQTLNSKLSTLNFFIYI